LFIFSPQRNQILKKPHYIIALLSIALVGPLFSSSVLAGTEVCDGNCKKEINVFKRYIKQDSPLAHMAMGHVYIMGNGVEVDTDKGLRYIKKAAKMEFGPAAFQLGYFYYHGMYVEQDFSLARRWLSKAAKKGIHNAEKLMVKLDGPDAEDNIKAELAETARQKKAARERQKDDQIERVVVHANNTYAEVIDSIRYLAGERTADMRAAGTVPYVFTRN
jgi:TPR repeat protein